MTHKKQRDYMLDEKKILNLNRERIYTLRGRGDQEGPEYHLKTWRPKKIESQSVTVHFQHQMAILHSEIRKWDIVIGCVAWLTNFNILRALERCKHVNILIQKEDFLRPDVGNWTETRIKEAYNALRPLRDYQWDTRFEDQATGEAFYYETYLERAIRCVGVVAPRGTVPARMHHKFLVFCELDKYDHIKPKAVWTGSLNLTENATRSLENSLLIKDETIAMMYTEEWRTLMLISESLDWDSSYVEPDGNLISEMS
jgi:hypothetical protein